MISVTRKHEICAGHRVVGHENKCRFFHGHNYCFELTLQGEELDSVGRVIDFSVIKDRLCAWLENTWDHKMLLWKDDPLAVVFLSPIYHNQHSGSTVLKDLDPATLVLLPFNPTVENIAMYFCESVAPDLLYRTYVQLVECKVWETSKCCATYTVKEKNANSVRHEREGMAEKESRFEDDVQETQKLV